MKENYVRQILNLFFTHAYPPQTEEKVKEWIANNSSTKEVDRTLFAIWNEIAIRPNKQTHRSFQKVKIAIGFSEPNGNRTLWSRRWFQCAAVLIPLFVFVATYLYFRPGVEMIEVATTASEQKECRLPDGTTVILNACSRVTYPSAFKADTRRVVLEGEAYFSVTSDAEKPFIVSTDYFSVKVLGTEFDVSAYPADERASTTLSSGRVEVHMKESKSKDSYTLEPSQKLIYDKSNHLVSLHRIDLTSMDWKDGKLIFRDTSFQDMIRILQRRFNVTIAYNQQAFLNVPYTVKFVHGEGLEEILKILQAMTGGFSYTVRGDVVKLTRTTSTK